MAKTYDTYKDSGIAWIGEIPGEWETSRLKFLINFINGFAFDSNDFSLEKDIPVIRQSDISENINWETTLKVEDDIKLEPYSLKFNDIIIGMSGSIGKLCIYTSPQKAYINQRVGIIRSKQNPFIYYLLQTKGFEEHNKLLSYGTAVLNISASNIGLFRIPFPPLSVQQSISSFLDTKCGEIDSLISIQEEMISELLAYKQSVITEAVTKGLDKKAKMKNSGVEWIGDIPEEWEVTKIKRVADTTSGSTPRSISNTSDSTIKWFRTTDINENIVSDSPIHLTKEEFSSASCPLLKPNTCLVAMYGGAGTIGKYGMLSEEATINQALCSIYSHERMYSKYIFFLLKALRPYWMKYASGTRKDPNINQEIVRNMLIPIPPLPVQQAIATYLDEKTSQIDSLIALKQSKIESLKEYKKSIIYEYVTGKKRV